MLISDPDNFGVTAQRHEIMATPSPQVSNFTINQPDPL